MVSGKYARRNLKKNVIFLFMRQPQKFDKCFKIKLKCYCSEPIRLRKFPRWYYIWCCLRLLDNILFSKKLGSTYLVSVLGWVCPNDKTKEGISYQREEYILTFYPHKCVRSTVEMLTLLFVRGNTNYELKTTSLSICH